MTHTDVRICMVLAFVALGVGCHSQKPKTVSPTAPAPTAAAPTAAAPEAEKPAPASPASPASEPLVLAAADVPDVIGFVLLPSVDGTAKRVAELANMVLPVPMDVQGLKAFAAARVGIPLEIVTALDLARPTAVALILDAETRAVAVVEAVPLASAGALQSALAKLGPPAGKRGAAESYALPGAQPIWVLVQGDFAFFATDVAALQRGALTAEKLARGGTSARLDVLATIWPDRVSALLRIQWALLAEKSLESVRAVAALVPNAKRILPVAEALGKVGAALLENTRALKLETRVSATEGVELSFRVDPRPGTTLAAIARSVPSAIVAPQQLGSTPALALGLSGPRPRGEPTPFWDALIKAFEASDDPANKTVGALYRAYFESSDGSVAARVTFDGKTGMRMDGVLGVKDAAAGKRYFDALTKASKDGSFEKMLRGTAGIQVKMRGEKVGGHRGMAMVIDVAKDRPERALLEKMYGKLPATSYFALADTRVAFALNGDAKARIAKLLSAKWSPPGDSLLRSVLASDRKRSLVTYIDMGAYMRLVSDLTGGKLPRGLLPGSQATLPLIFDTGVGADEIDATLRLPASFFQVLGTQYKRM